MMSRSQRRSGSDDDAPQVAEVSHLTELAAEAERLGTSWPEEEPEPARKRHWWQWWNRGTNTLVTGNTPGSVTSQGMGGL